MEIGISLNITGTIQLGGSAPAEPTLEANVWPQPTFDSDVGLTLTETVIADGELQFMGPESGPQICAMTTPPTLTTGEVWHYSVTLSDTNPASPGVKLEVGGADAVDVGSLTAGQVFTGTITIPASPVQQIRFREASGFLSGNVSAFTLQREA